MDISEKVGDRIRRFRKAKGLSQEQLGNMIGKGKYTVSKYESGDIVMDIQTLYDIAQALSIPTSVLIGRTTDTIVSDNPISNFVDTDLIYMYILHQMENQKQKILKSIITLEAVKDDDDLDKNIIRAVWYNQLLDINDITTAKSVVPGTLEVYESVSMLTFQNKRRHNYKTVMLAMNFSNDLEYTHGMAMTIASYPPIPITSRITLSKVPLLDKDRLKTALALNREDWKQFKRYNGFTLKTNMLNSGES